MTQDNSEAMTDLDDRGPEADAADAADVADVAVADGADVADVADVADGADAADAVDVLQGERRAAGDSLEEQADGTPPTEAVAAGGTDQPVADEARLKQLEREGDIAADYLEELLDIADLDGDLDMDVEGDRAAVSIVGADLNQLVGKHGEVLEALQELTRLAVLRETGERSRLMLDISGHRAQRRRVLEGQALEAVESVRSSGESVSLRPMTPFERKVVHDAVAHAGLVSSSEGVEPKRYVVIRPS